MDTLEMEAVAARMIRDESRCVECVLFALYLCGVEASRVCVTTINHDPLEPPSIEVHRGDALVARAHWRRSSHAFELHLWLHRDLRAAFARSRALLEPEAEA